MAALVRFEFQVQKIIAMSQDGSCQVQWTPSWVSRSNLVNCEHLIQEFLRPETDQDMKCEPERELEETEHVTTEIDGSKHHMHDPFHWPVRKDMNSNHADGAPLQPITFPAGVAEENACVGLDTYSAKELEFHEQQTEYDTESEPANLIKSLNISSEMNDSEPLVQECLHYEADIPAEVGDNSCERPYEITHEEANSQTTLQPSTSAVKVEEGKISAGEDTNTLIDHILVTSNTTQKIHFNNDSDRRNSSEIGSTSGHMILNDIDKECLSENSSKNSSTTKPHIEPEISRKDGDDNELPCSTNSLLCTQNCDLDQDNSIGINRKTCSICKKSFRYPSQLTKHLRIHTGERPYTCKECGKSFAENFNLTVHLRSHTSDKPFHCDVCAKSFRRKSTLQDHKLTHTGEKPYSCPQCTYSCVWKDNLMKHMRTHTGEKPFTCDVCGKKFTQSHPLKQHMHNKHTSERPFSCEVCGKKFPLGSILKQHIRTHQTKKKSITGCSHLKEQQNDQKAFSCSYCDTCFASSRDLRKHLRTHR